MADRPTTPRLDVLIDRACRHLTPAEGRALRAGVQELALAQFELTNQRETFNIAWEQQAADLERARGERGTYRDAWHSARDRARKATERRDSARRWAVHLENENARTADELAGARATIDHMSAAMSWIAGHDRQGLDHLEEAQYEARARESAIEQARSWARRAERAEQQLANVRAECDAIEREQYPVADDGMAIAVRRVRAALDAAGQPDPERAREDGQERAIDAMEPTDAPEDDGGANGPQTGAQDREEAQP